MPKIRVKGIKEIFEIDLISAKKIKAILEDDNYNSFYTISVGDIVTKKGDIVALVLEEFSQNNSDKKRYDLYDPFDVEIINQFELEFLTWCENQNEPKRTFEYYAWSQKAIWFSGSPQINFSGKER